MRNASDKSCRENRNTHLMFSNSFLDNVDKYGRARQATGAEEMRMACRINKPKGQT